MSEAIRFKRYLSRFALFVALPLHNKYNIVYIFHACSLANILGIIIRNEPNSFHNIETMHVSVLTFHTDHIPGTFNVTLRIPRLPKQSCTGYNFKKADSETFQKKFRDADLTDLISTTLNGELWELVFQLTSLIDEHIPKVKLKSINSPLWIVGQVNHLLRKQNVRNKT